MQRLLAILHHADPHPVELFLSTASVGFGTMLMLQQIRSLPSPALAFLLSTGVPLSLWALIFLLMGILRLGALAQDWRVMRLTCSAIAGPLWFALAVGSFWLGAVGGAVYFALALASVWAYARVSVAPNARFYVV